MVQVCTKHLFSCNVNYTNCSPFIYLFFAHVNSISAYYVHEALLFLLEKYESLLIALLWVDCSKEAQKLGSLELSVAPQYYD